MITRHSWLWMSLLLLPLSFLSLPVSAADDIVYWNNAQTINARLKQDQDFWRLVPHYESQRSQALCGVASAVVVMNALDIPRPYSASHFPYRVFTQNNLFNRFNTQNTLRLESDETPGFSRDQLEVLIENPEVEVTNISGSSLNQAQLIALLNKVLISPDTYVLANFSRKALGQDGGGHWSPIAAYDPQSNSILLLDVARYRYMPSWVPAERMLQAINTMDISSGQTRGLLLVNRKTILPPAGARQISQIIPSR